MSAPIPESGLTVERSALATQIKGQLRIGMAVLAGIVLGRLVDRGWLPAGLNNNGTAEMIVGVVLYAIPAGWQWFRVRLQHARLWALAVSHRVPADLVRPAASSAPGVQR